jgi:hypothetical protein
MNDMSITKDGGGTVWEQEPLGKGRVRGKSEGKDKYDNFV